MLPEDHEEEERELPGPGCQEDPVLAAQNRVQRPQDVLVPGGLQAQAQARHHEEPVGDDVDLEQEMNR